MKILIIGNSHVGSLKRAWDIIGAQYSSEYELYFAAARGNELGDAFIEAGQLCSNNSKVSKSLKMTYGKARVDFQKLMPDRVLIYGCQLLFNRFLKTHRSFDEGIYSIQCKKNALQDIYSRAFGFNLAIKIHKAYSRNGKVLISAPAPSQENSTQNAKKKNEDADKRRDEILKLVEFSNKSFFHEFGLEYVLQPPCTLGEDLTSTLHKYSLGSRALSVGDKNDNRVHDQSDRNHMNDEFGKLFLETLFAKLEKKLI